MLSLMKSNYPLIFVQVLPKYNLNSQLLSTIELAIILDTINIFLMLYLIKMSIFLSESSKANVKLKSIALLLLAYINSNLPAEPTITRISPSWQKLYLNNGKTKKKNPTQIAKMIRLICQPSLILLTPLHQNTVL